MKKIYFLLFILYLSNIVGYGQSVIPPSEGSFETITPTGDPATDFSGNGWTVVNGAANKFFVGAAAGASAGSYSAFTGVSYTDWSSLGVVSVSHFYRDIIIPAGQTNLNIKFRYKISGNTSGTAVKVFLVPVSTTPVAGSNLSAGQLGPQFGFYGTTDYTTYILNAPVTPNAPYRIVFSYNKPNTSGNASAASIDEIQLSAANTIPPNPTIISTSSGGFFDSPETWVGGVVPSFSDNAVIADGAIVTILSNVYVKNLTVGGGSSGILQWGDFYDVYSLFVDGDLLVNPGAKFITTNTRETGQDIEVAGTFENNGFALFSNQGSYLYMYNPLGNSAITGTGIFAGGIIPKIYFRSSGMGTISTSQNITTYSFNSLNGPINTNGKLSVNNAKIFFGDPLNQQVMEIAMTESGSGYLSSSPPTVVIAAPQAGVTATAVPIIDDATGTIRALKITNPGSGYRIASPAISIIGGTGSDASARSLVLRFGANDINIARVNQYGQYISGGIDIKSDQAIGGVYSVNPGIGYTTAPAVGFALPTAYQNLVSAGGSGYTSPPVVTVSGGSALPGSVNPTFTVTVAGGKVASVICTGGGTLWTSIPTLTITGGGGSGATAAFPAGCLATATAIISNGFVSGYTITNGGFGYSTYAPAVGLSGGGFTAAATAASRAGLYILSVVRQAGGGSSILNEGSEIPANRRIFNYGQSLTGFEYSLAGDLDIYGNSFDMSGGVINLNNGHLNFSNPSLAGITGNAASFIKNGKISLSSPGGSVTRTFPFDARVVLTTGSGSNSTGSTITKITVAQTGAPSGSVSPAGTPIGTRAYHVITNSGAVYGTNPAITLNYNSSDNLNGNQEDLTISQATALTGPWTIRSIPAGTGSLPATGSRITATTAPGPITPTGDDYYAWTTAALPPSGFVTIMDGNWNNPAIWAGGVIPGAADVVTINSNVTVTAAASCYSLSVSSGKSVTVQPGVALDVFH